MPITMILPLASCKSSFKASPRHQINFHNDTDISTRFKLIFQLLVHILQCVHGLVHQDPEVRDLNLVLAHVIEPSFEGRAGPAADQTRKRT